MNVKQCAKLVYTEFFTQGDLEKAMGNKPVESMDREKAFIPSLQIQFIDHIVLPVYKLLKVADIFGCESSPISFNVHTLVSQLFSKCKVRLSKAKYGLVRLSKAKKG